MNKNKFLLPLCLSVAFTYPSFSQAQDSYQYVAGAGYANTDYDFDFEITTLLGVFQMYTAPVSYTEGPRAEAAFLNRQPTLLLSYGTVDFEIATESIDGTDLIAGFEYANQNTPFTFGVLYNQAEADETILGTEVEVTQDVLGFQMGYYLTGRSRISVEYSQEENEILVGGSSFVQLEQDTYGVSYKNVNYLENNRFLNINVGAAYIDNDIDEQNTEFVVAADYYFDRAIRVGAGIGINSGDNIFEEGTTISVNINAFLSPLASIGFNFEQFSADEPDNDEQTIGMNFAIRF
ncbi:MAG: putative porin [Gammaproteobacteria bacterium]|nr:putative porin [Gammaproteobacteria bacterium]